MKDKGEQVVSLKNGVVVFFRDRKGGKTERKMFYSTAIYNLPPLQKHKIIKETSLKNSLWWIRRILDFS